MGYVAVYENGYDQMLPRCGNAGCLRVHRGKVHWPWLWVQIVLLRPRNFVSECSVLLLSSRICGDLWRFVKYVLIMCGLIWSMYLHRRPGSYFIALATLIVDKKLLSSLAYFNFAFFCKKQNIYTYCYSNIRVIEIAIEIHYNVSPFLKSIFQIIEVKSGRILCKVSFLSVHLFIIF